MPKTIIARITRLSILATLLLGLAACGSPEQPESSNPAQSPSPTAHTFTVRGQVETLPVPGKPGSSLMIHHEAIPGFVDPSGSVVGMAAMTMPFTPAKDLTLEAIQPGDKIEFTLVLDWDNNRSEITKITALPEDTALDFGGEMPAMDMDGQK